MSDNYSKCIILNGCIIPDEFIIEIVYRLCGNKYLGNTETESVSYLTENFFDDICSGIEIKDSNLELRKYKISDTPFIEEYYLIVSKIVLDLNELRSIRLEIIDPTKD